MLRASSRGRPERFRLMAIASAGQVRQWRRHLRACVGRTVFDYPTLTDCYFECLLP